MSAKEKWINFAALCLSMVLIVVIVAMVASLEGKAGDKLIAVTGQGVSDKWMCSSRAHGKVPPAQVGNPITPQTP